MTFNISLLPDRLKKGMSVLSSYFDFTVGDGISLTAEKGDRLEVAFDGQAAHITYPAEVAFYRGVGHVLQAEGCVNISEQANFDMCGAMYDNSRNGVLNLSYTKRFIATLAMLGMNTYLMYMEDVYTVKSEPLFGYMRGAYSPDELKEIDNFAFDLGIEVIPCIQTLAHLDKFLKFYNMRWKYGDIDDILEVGSEQVQELLDSMFAAMRASFRTNRLHAGMDEAYFVGRGKYLDHNGYQPRKQVMLRQIELISKLAQKYDYQIIMWDDMFYRGEGSELTGKRPDNIHLVYWNYYDENTDTYLDKLDMRLADDPDTFFAGGAWRWGSAVPCHRKTEITTNAALAACLQRGVRNVFVALWGDDGSETPVEAGLFGVTMFAEHCYGGDFKAKLKWISGMNYEQWMLQDSINNFCDACGHDNSFDKYALYQDPLCGLHDQYIRFAAQRADLTDHYHRLAEQFDALQGEANRLYAALCRVLELKWNFGVRLCDAYKSGDKAELLKLSQSTDTIIALIENLRQCRLELWVKENKLEGFEVLDGRYGALIARFKTVATLIDRYLAGEIEKIEPLDTERLLHTGGGEIMRLVEYSMIYSAGGSW